MLTFYILLNFYQFIIYYITNSNLMMFPVLCIGSFIVFSSYWFITNLYIKTINQNKQKSQIKTLNKHMKEQKQEIFVNQNQEQVINQEQKQQTSSQIRIKTPAASKLTNFSDNQDKYASKMKDGVLKLPQKKKQQQLSVNSATNQLDVAMIDNVQDKKIQQEQIKNQINQKQQKIKNDKSYTPLLKYEQNGQIPQSDEEPLSPFQQYMLQQQRKKIFDEQKMKQFCKQEQKPVPKQVQIQRPQQQTQLQIIQALSNQKSQNRSSIQSQIIPVELQRKQTDRNSQVSKLIQQIDELFLNDQSQFLRIMNKYKIQQSPIQNIPPHQVQQVSSQVEGKIEQLQLQLRRKNSQMGMLEIQISQYKAANDGKQAQVQELKSKKQQIQQKVYDLQKQNIELKKLVQKMTESSFTKSKKVIQYVVNTEKQQQLKKKIQQLQKRNEQLQGQKQELQIATHEIELKEQFYKNADKEKQQKLLQFKKVLAQKEKQIKNLKQELSATRSRSPQRGIQIEFASYRQLQQKKNKQQAFLKQKEQEKYRFREQQFQKKQAQYMKRLQQSRAQIQKIKKQATQEKNRYSQLLKLRSNNLNAVLIKQKQQAENTKNQYHSLSTRENLIQSSISQGNSKYSNEEISQLHEANQNLKNQIEFAQTQMRMFQESEAHHLGKIKQLQKIIQERASPQVMDLRAKISQLQPLANQYEIMKKRYLQTKIKYQKLMLQKQKKQEKIYTYFNGKQIASQIISSKNSGSPQIQRIVKISNENSPDNNSKITEFSNKSKSNSSKNKNGGSSNFLFDCNFITPQQKQFIQKTLLSLLQGVIKTEKLYNSKTNRDKNPHEFIDNIRGILVVIQLQNEKILAAYTHEGFSPLHLNSTNQNIAFIMDVGNRRSFANQSGLNSISYNSSSLIWGFNEIMLKYEEPQVLYTNFCRNHNIYWDGKHKLQQFIGCDKQWARIIQYQLFRVSKV